MRQLLNTTLLYLLIPILFSNCNNIDCPGGGLDFHFSGDLLVEGTEKVSKMIRVQYPRDCSNNPREGYYELRILNENEIPGLSLSLTEFSVTNSWFGHQTPPSGEVEVQLWAWPEEGGSLNAPEPGTYQIRIEAAFESEASVEKVLTVQVLSDGFSVVLIEPNADSEYSEQTTIIQVNALARDQTHGITSLDYRFNQDPWVENPYTDVLQVEFEEWIDVPTYGEHVFQVRAINGQGDELIAEQDIFIPEDPTQLTDHNWDGGGDNLNWGDPLNWEDDRLPGPKDRARISNSQTSEVRIGNDQAAERVFSVGAVRIDPDMVLAGNTVLQLEAPENRSEVSATRFEVLNGNQRPKIRFGEECRECRLEFRNTLNMSEFTLQAYQAAEVVVNRGSVGEGSFNGFSQGFMDGPIELRIAGNTQFLEPVNWTFGLMPGGDQGPTINLSRNATWNLTNGSTFLTENEAPTQFNLEGTLQVNFQDEDFVTALVFRGNIQIQSSFTWRVFNNHPSSAGSIIILNSTSPEVSTITHYNGNVRLLIEGGKWHFNRPGSSGGGSLRLENGSELDITRGVIRLDSATVTDNSRLNVGNSYFAKTLYVQSGRLELDENCEIGELRFEEGIFSIGSTSDTNTVKINRMYWLGGEDRSPMGARGTLEFIDAIPPGENLPLTGLFQINPSDAGDHRWNTHIILSNQSTLQWLSGNLYSNGNRVLQLNLSYPTSRFEIDASRRKLWGFNTLAGGEAASFLRIQNSGTLVISGNEEVNIAGCLTLIGEGSLEEDRNGQLNMIASDGFCE